MEKKAIAVFDFDNTITKKDSMIDFILDSFGIAGVLFLLYLAPVFLLFKVGLLSRHRAKEIMFSVFFKDMSEKKYRKRCEEYSLKKIDNIVKKEALEKIEWHKTSGHELIILSASLEDWLKPWAFKNGFSNVLSTIPEIKNGRITGKFATKNCYGIEKRERFLNYIKNREEYYVYMYGDSNGDKEMLETADKGFYRKFF